MMSVLVEGLNLSSRVLSSIPGMQRFRFENKVFARERFQAMDRDAIRSLKATSREMALVLAGLLVKMMVAMALEDDEDRDSPQKRRYNWYQNQLSRAVTSLTSFLNPLHFVEDHSRIGTLAFAANLYKLLGNIGRDSGKASRAFWNIAPVPRIAFNAVRGIMPREDEFLYDSLGGDFGYVHDLGRDVSTSGEHSAKKEVKKLRDKERKQLRERYMSAAKGDRDILKALVDSGMRERFPEKKGTYKETLERIKKGEKGRVGERERLRRALERLGVDGAERERLLRARFE